MVRGTVGPEGARLSYLAAEDGAGGETILLIHGAGVSARSWIHQLERPDELNERIHTFVRAGAPAAPRRIVPVGWRAVRPVLRSLLGRTRAALRDRWRTRAEG